jgi:hypothetical protein
MGPSSGIAAGEVVVHGHHVDAGAGARVPGDRGRAGQRLAFAGLHFDDLAARQRQRALQLHVEHVLPQDAGSGGRHRRDPRAQILGLGCGGPQFGVAQTREAGTHRVDLLDARPVAVAHRMQPLQHRLSYGHAQNGPRPFALLIAVLTDEGRYKESAGGGRWNREESRSGTVAPARMGPATKAGAA